MNEAKAKKTASKSQKDGAMENTDIEKYCIKRNQYNKYSKKLEDGISDSDKDLLTRYLSSKLFGSQLYIRDLKKQEKRRFSKEIKICN